MTFRGLPPLASLRAFEATARLSSFKAAAAELFVTPTAISHQIRQLEAHLGVRVLDRTPRSVSLTADGRRLYEATVSAFDGILRVADDLRHGQRGQQLTLSSTTAFLSHWLVPRLGQIQALFPELDLRLHASDAVVPLRQGAVDIAIRYGKGPFAGVAATPLAADRYAPVCSPGLHIRSAGDLRRARLIHIDGRTAPLPLPDWERWCAQAGITGVDTGSGLRFTDGMHAIQAAIAGNGVVLVSVVLVADALAEGLLAMPFEQTLAGDAYHFVCAPELDSRADVVRLRDWFLETMDAASPRLRPHK
ncbi:LysR substrate-binding domain-containing protein [Rugamonas rivuli]|uniref:LysR family transcriptional regulator n=1 Tax=Rugamonas rivuli TaxID=2743358 RepID=A0A843SFH5_9BURK|nr:LysR substrate-binding domain-containing protein [Rugamonas rivuli]MQA23039.1 LysR family transcriptional regulator [Rugamonas rivuli]